MESSGVESESTRVECGVVACWTDLRPRGARRPARCFGAAAGRPATVYDNDRTRLPSIRSTTDQSTGLRRRGPAVTRGRATIESSQLTGRRVFQYRVTDITLPRYYRSTRRQNVSGKVAVLLPYPGRDPLSFRYPSICIGSPGYIHVHADPL